MSKIRQWYRNARDEWDLIVWIMHYHLGWKVEWMYSNEAKRIKRELQEMCSSKVDNKDK